MFDSNLINNKTILNYLHSASLGKLNQVAHNLYLLRNNNGSFYVNADVSDIINHQIRLAGLVDIPKVSKILHQNIKTNIKTWNFKRAQKECHVDNLLCDFSLQQRHQGFCFVNSGKLYIYVLGANIISDLNNLHIKDAERETAKANKIINSHSALVTSPELDMEPITQKSMQKLAKNIYTELNIYFSKNTKRK